MAEDAQKVARALLEQMKRYSLIIEEMFAKFVKKIGGKISTVGDFFTNLANAGEQIAKTLAKSLVQKAVGAAQGVVGIIEGLKGQIRMLRRLVKKIIGLLQRGMNNIGAVAAQVVKLVKRFRNLFMSVIEAIKNVLAAISPISALLSAINAVRRILQTMFDWVSDTTAVNSLLRKVKKLAKGFVKQLKSVKKELKPMPRQVRPLLAG